MVLKLIKNEFIDSRKKFLNIIFAIVLGTVVLTLMNYTPDNNAIFNFAAVLLVIVLVITMFAAFVVLPVLAYIDLLYKSMYGKRGYKLFTMPVKSWQIIVSKVVVAGVWSVVIGIVSLLSTAFFLMVMLSDAAEVRDVIFSFIKFFGSHFNFASASVLIISTIASFVFSIVLFLLAGAVANTSWFQNRRALVTVVILVLLTFLTNSLFNNFATDIFRFGIIPTAPPSLTLPIQWDSIISISVINEGLKTLLLVSVLKLLLAGIASFAIVWLWEKKLEVID